MKNSKGFSLIEVMTALAMFMVVATATMPILTHVYKERLAISEERKALEILQNRMQMWLANGGTPDDSDSDFIPGTSYHFRWDKDPQSDIVTACITWTGSNERGYEKCSYSKMIAGSP